MKKTELLIRTLILPLDYIAVFVSFLLAYQLREQLGESFLISLAEFIPLIVILSLVWILCFWLIGVYKLETQPNRWEEIFGVILGSFAAITIASSLIFFVKEIDFSRIVLIATLGFSLVLLISIRLIREMIMQYLYRKGIGIHRVLVVGDGSTSDLFLAGIKESRLRGFDVVGITDYANFESEFMRLAPDEVVQANPDLTSDQTGNIFSICEEHGATFRFVPNLFETPVANVASTNIAGVPIITVSATSVSGWYSVIKRAIDLLVSGFALILLSPLFAFLAIAIKLDSPGPVFFKDPRIGRGWRKFRLFKFRSMEMIEKDGKLFHSQENKEMEKLREQQPNYKLENDPRITHVGHFIRKTSLDELAQLWNVFKGEISLVGPRAFEVHELGVRLEQYPETKPMVQRMLKVKPGITGLWQISGRSALDYTERVAMDAYYATNASLAVDIKILLQTIPVVLKGEGAM